MEGERGPHSVPRHSVDFSQFPVIKLVHVRGAGTEQACVDDVVGDPRRPLGEIHDVEDPIVFHGRPELLWQPSATVAPRFETESWAALRHLRYLAKAGHLG